MLVYQNGNGLATAMNRSVALPLKQDTALIAPVWRTLDLQSQVAQSTEPILAPTVDMPKILLYSHDTFGLGNIRRTLLLAQAMRDEYPDAAILIVTGSPVIHSFRIPDGIDYIKLPCLDRIDAEQYEPRFLQQWSDEIRQMRQAILRKTILGFHPDLMIVDKRPGGIDGELLDTIQALHTQTPRPKLVLGIRDILDTPERTQRSLHRKGAFDLMERYYDEIWIYGVPEVFDTIQEYNFPTAVTRKTRYCGYLQRPTISALPKQKLPHVLVTTGGGGDGGDVIEAYLEGLLELPRRVLLQTTIVFGPQMPEVRRNRLLEQYGHLADVKFYDFKSDLTHQYAEADVVVSMAGYNTVCELLSFGKRAILIPRAEPVQEQLIRARRFAQLGYFDLLERGELTPERLLTQVLAILDSRSACVPSVDLDGLPRIRTFVRALLSEKAS